MTLEETISQLEKFGYTTLLSVRLGSVISTHELMPMLQPAFNIVNEICARGLNVKLTFSTNEDSFYVHVVDINKKEGDIMLPATDMPTFKDFVADEIARFIEIREAQLTGDELPSVVLQNLVQDLQEGAWKNYANVSVEDVQNRGSGS